MESRFKVDVLVGAFVFGTIVVFCLFLLKVSDSTGLFTKKAVIYTSYAEAPGIAKGTPVLFQGMKAGSVLSVKLADPLPAGISEKEALEKSKVNVELELEAVVLQNIGKNAKAQITTEGLLGDNLIAITRGTPETFGHLNDGDFIPGQDASGMLDALTPVAETLDQMLSDIHGDMDKHGKYKTSIGETLGNVRDITASINAGEGTLGALINDPAGKDTAKNVEELTDNLATITGELHDRGFEKDLQGTLAKAEELTGNLAKITGDLDERDIDKEIKEILVNVEDLTKNLASITKKIDNGEGTVGAIINDRKMYEEISTLLAGAQRSEVVRAAVRHVYNTKLLDAEKERQRRAQEIRSRQSD